MIRFQRTSAVLILMVFSGLLCSGAADEPDRIPSSRDAVPELISQVRTSASTEEARGRAQLLHELIREMLPVIHHEFYREDEGLTLPAAAFRDVFRTFEERQGVSIRWLAVDVEPMNLDHRPREGFEQDAATALKNGKPWHESVAEGRYRYAGTITLTAECLKCHVPNRTNLKDRLAGVTLEMAVGMPAAEEE